MFHQIEATNKYIKVIKKKQNRNSGAKKYSKWKNKTY